MIWTEAAIAQELDGHLWSMEFMESGRVKVVDLLAVPEDYTPNAPNAWKDSDLQMLYDLKRAGLPIDEIATRLDRTMSNTTIQWGRRWHWRHRIDPRLRFSASLEEISRAVRQVYGVTSLEFKSERRAKRITEARQVFYWIARHFTAHSFPVIANYAGGRDHSTAMHGVKKVTEQMDRFRGGIDLILFDLGLSMDLIKEQAA